MSAYLTNFTGEIDVNNIASEEVISKMEQFINQNFKEVMSLDRNTKTIYVNGDMDDKNEYMERFMVKIHPHLSIDPDSEDVPIKAQGQDPKDRWDIVLKPDGVYIREYEFTEASIRKYN